MSSTEPDTDTIPTPFDDVYASLRTLEDTHLHQLIFALQCGAYGWDSSADAVVDLRKGVTAAREIIRVLETDLIPRMSRLSAARVN